MDKASEHEKQLKNPQVTKPELQGSGATPHEDSSPDMQTGRAQRMMNNAMSTTERVGSGVVGGVTNVATDLVHGVGAVGGEMVTVVTDTANTAIAGVGSIGETAVHTVTGLLADLFGGLREIGSAARGRYPSPATEDEPRLMEGRRQSEQTTH